MDRFVRVRIIVVRQVTFDLADEPLQKTYAYAAASLDPPQNVFFEIKEP
jgi:hypothetical protein